MWKKLYTFKLKKVINITYYVQINLCLVATPFKNKHPGNAHY